MDCALARDLQHLGCEVRSLVHCLAQAASCTLLLEAHMEWGAALYQRASAQDTPYGAAVGLGTHNLLPLPWRNRDT